MLFSINLKDDELAVMDKILDVRSSLKYSIAAPSRWYGLLRRNTLARAIRGSNSIEGYTVTPEDAIAAAAGEEPLDAKRETWAAVTGYRNAMTYVLQLRKDPRFVYNEGFIRSMHYMMIHYDLSKNPGNWRPGPIYVRDEVKQEIVYEGPDAELVPALMQELIAELNSKFLHDERAIITAAMAHLNLAMIHPFSDGNGRMARCLQTMVLAMEGIFEPPFCSIEEYLGHNTQDYYDVLARVGQGSWHPENDAHPWIRFNLTAHYRQAMTLLRRTRFLRKLWDELEIELVKRGLPERASFALADATIGYRVRNSSYRDVAEVSDQVASRDLKALVDEGLLIADGEKRGRGYVASAHLLELRERIAETGPIPDPFELPKQPTLFGGGGWSGADDDGA